MDRVRILTSHPSRERQFPTCDRLVGPTPLGAGGSDKGPGGRRARDTRLWLGTASAQALAISQGSRQEAVALAPKGEGLSHSLRPGAGPRAAHLLPPPWACVSPRETPVSAVLSGSRAKSHLKIEPSGNQCHGGPETRRCLPTTREEDLRQHPAVCGGRVCQTLTAAFLRTVLLTWGGLRPINPQRVEQK